MHYIYMYLVHVHVQLCVHVHVRVYNVYVQYGVNRTGTGSQLDLIS